MKYTTESVTVQETQVLPLSNVEWSTQPNQLQYKKRKYYLCLMSNEVHNRISYSTRKARIAFV